MSARTTFHPGKLLIFLIVSVADLFLTRHLLLSSEGKVYESNPLASAWLESYGVDGLVIFKCLAMLLVVFLATYISFHRPKVGGRILAFGCLVTGFVVVYSWYLSGNFQFFAGSTKADEVWMAESKGLQLDQEIIREREYTYLLNRLARDLVVKRCSLSEAVEQLTQAEKGRDPRWLQMLKHHYSTDSDGECLALHLGQHALLHCCGNNRHMVRLAHHFEREFWICFGNNADFNRREEHLVPTFLRLAAGQEKTTVESPPSW